MNYKQEVKHIYELTTSEYNACRRLCFGRDGDMYFHIAEFRQDPRAWVILLKYPIDDRLIGWALVTPTARKRKRRAAFYVRATERNKGYGSLLMAEVRKIYPKPIVFPHDKRSAAFLAKYYNNVTASDEYAWYPRLLEKEKKLRDERVLCNT